MNAWGLPVDDAYENEVVERALTPPTPELHAHAQEEMGMCSECDAAAILESVRAE